MTTTISVSKFSYDVEEFDFNHLINKEVVKTLTKDLMIKIFNCRDFAIGDRFYNENILKKPISKPKGTSIQNFDIESFDFNKLIYILLNHCGIWDIELEISYITREVNIQLVKEEHLRDVCIEDNPDKICLYIDFPKDYLGEKVTLKEDLLKDKFGY